MAWAAALGSIIGSGSEGMASAAQYQASKHERNVQWRRAQAWELMAPSLRMEGLRNAGINPILAAGMPGGGHMSQPGMATTGGSPSFDKDSVGRAVSSARQMKMMADQVATVAAERSKAESEALAAKYLPERAYHEAGAASEQWSKLQQETLKLLAERGLTGAREAESVETRRRIEVDRMLMQMGVPGARAMEELYERHPWLRQVKEFGAGNVIQTGIGLGAAGAAAGAGYLTGKDRSKKKRR